MNDHVRDFCIGSLILGGYAVFIGMLLAGCAVPDRPVRNHWDNLGLHFDWNDTVQPGVPPDAAIDRPHLV